MIASTGQNTEDAIDSKIKRISGILRILIPGIGIAYGIVFAISFLYGDLAAWIVAAAGLSLLIPPFILLISGRIRASCWALSLCMILTITLFATFGQGYRDFSMLLFPITIAFTSMTMDRPIFIANSVLMAASLAWLVFGQMLGLYAPIPARTGAYWSDFTLLILALMGSAFVVHALAANLRATLDRAQAEIAQRSEAEKRLRESEERYRSIFENATLAINISKGPRILYANRSFLEMFGLPTFEELERLPPLELFSPEWRPRILENIDKRAKGLPVPMSYESECLHRDGTAFPVRIYFARATFEGESALVSFILDISEQKAAEAEQLKNEIRFQQNQKLESLGVLAGGIAHDFNNLLGGIYGYIELAQARTEDEEVALRLAKAVGTIDRARALTLQLLTFAKGGLPIKAVSPLFPFVSECAKFALSGSSVVCGFKVQDGLWPCEFDKNQIGQVIDNMVINAKQALPVGGAMEISARNRSISGKRRPALPEGDYVEISIKDEGIGISEEDLPRIFDPFFTTKPGGHGLGLASCYSIIKRHGGCIEVDSKRGRGTHFRIFLPAARESFSASVGAPAFSHKGSGTFLVMDDEEIIRETACSMLGRFGYSAVATENGREAVEFVSTELEAGRRISGIILDLTVPGGMGGKEAIAAIRALSRDIPAFVTSGYADDPIMSDPDEYGFTASIRKPFIEGDLAEILEKHMKPSGKIGGSP